MTRRRGLSVKHRAVGQLPVLHRRLTYAVCGLVYASGVLWLLFHYGVAAHNDFGPARHPLESWWLRLHGAAAMGFLIVLGSLLPAHIGEAWGLRRNFSTGVVMLAATAFLVITGWGLYYLGNETLRAWLSVGHWAIGAAGAPLLVVHMLVGRRQKDRIAHRAARLPSRATQVGPGAPARSSAGLGASKADREPHASQEVVGTVAKSNTGPNVRRKIPGNEIDKPADAVVPRAG